MSNLTAQQIYEKTRGIRREQAGSYFGIDNLPFCDICKVYATRIDLHNQVKHNQVKNNK